MNEDDVVLVMDTATRTPTLALARMDGQLIEERQWVSEHRHGEQLLQRLDELLSAVGVDRRELRGVIAGIGPGSFTGLRIGLATAKVIAYSLDAAIVGISTLHALALASASEDAASEALALSLPAGAADRYVQRISVAADSRAVEELGPAELAVPGPGFEEAVGDALLVAVDMAAGGDISDDAVGRGQSAVAGLARGLATLGIQALANGRRDDVARLVPAYVALPRGIPRAAAEMTWSPDLR